MSRTLMKAMKNICNFRQMFSPATFASVFPYQTLKYSLEKNFSQSIQSSDVVKNDKNFRESLNDENGELGIYISCKEDPTLPLVKLTIITKDGKEVPIEARVGMTVMRAIMKQFEYDIDLGIEAACDGELACTTCHVYCEDSEKYFTPISETEQDLLDAVPCSTSHSRLSCQMKILKEFENVRIQIPTDSTNYFTEGANKSKSS